MANLRRIQLCISVISILLDNAMATDPIFKFIPKSSLSSLAVQTDSTYDIQMIVGTNAAASTVFRVNGPFENNNSGMIGVSMTTISKGSNVNAPDFSTAKTDQSSTANDGLYDVIFKNFTSISRSNPSTATISSNEIKLEAKMKTVDLPGATGSTTLWVWASAEIGDEYVWVSEESTTIQRSNSDDSLITITTTTPNLPINTLISGDKLKINGKIEHTSASRLNAYGAIIRFYLPPYAELVQGSYQTTDPLFPSAEVTYNSQNSEKELIMRYSKVGITSKPSFSVEIRLNANNLHLKAGQIYEAKIDVIQSYCKRKDCSGNIDSKNMTLLKNFRRREAGDTFLVQHIASSRCLSYTAGANSDKVTVKATCTDLFTYDSNGGLKHVTSGSCAYEDSGFIKMSTSKCSNATIFYKEVSGYLRFFSSPTHCLTAADTGLENKDVIKSSTCSNNEKFKFIDAVAASKRIAMGKKVVLASGSAEFFYCNRQSREFQPSCFYKNGTYTSEIKALPVAMAYLKAYDPVAKELYGIDFTGKCHIMVRLAQNPEDVFQLEDTLYDTIKSKPGMIISTEITESSLQNYPVQHLSTEYAVSLKGIHQKYSSVWKLIFRW